MRSHQSNVMTVNWFHNQQISEALCCVAVASLQLNSLSLFLLLLLYFPRLYWAQMKKLFNKQLFLAFLGNKLVWNRLLRFDASHRTVSYVEDKIWFCCKKLSCLPFPGSLCLSPTLIGSLWGAEAQMQTLRVTYRHQSVINVAREVWAWTTSWKLSAER